MTRYRIPSRGISKEEHDALVAELGRPLTQDPPQPRTPDTGRDTSGGSVIDDYLAHARRNTTTKEAA